MADDPTWEGLAKGILVMGILWWAWVGYAWLTSVIDPEEGAVRIVFFVAMAAFLVAALCVPEAFGDLGLTIAIAYGVVRVCHIFLFMLASADDPGLRRSVIGLAVSTAISVALLVGAAALDGWAQGTLWALALLLDAGGPYFFGSEGWKLAPEHFAERHALILIVALGESIVAIGAGVETAVTIGVIGAAVVGVGIAASQWWVYFDLSQIASARRLASMEVGRERNELARDSYSYIHFLLVAGIVLVALGMKKTIGDTRGSAQDRARLRPRTAAPPCTCSVWSPSAGGTSAPSRRAGSSPGSSASRSSRSRSRSRRSRRRRSSWRSWSR